MDDFKKFLKDNNYEGDLEFQLCDLGLAFDEGKKLKWKPSEGQLECLGYAIEKAEKDWSPLTNNRIYLTLKALKEQLEKLKGE